MGFGAAPSTGPGKVTGAGLSAFPWALDNREGLRILLAVSAKAPHCRATGPRTRRMQPSLWAWGRTAGASEAVLGHFLGLSQRPGDTPVGLAGTGSSADCLRGNTGPWSGLGAAFDGRRVRRVRLASHLLCRFPRATCLRASPQWHFGKGQFPGRPVAGGGTDTWTLGEGAVGGPQGCMQCFVNRDFFKGPNTSMKSESHAERASRPRPSAGAPGAQRCPCLGWAWGWGLKPGTPGPHKEGCVVTGHTSLPGALPTPCVRDTCLVLCFSGQLGEKQVPASAADDRVKDEFSDLSEG